MLWVNAITPLRPFSPASGLCLGISILSVSQICLFFSKIPLSFLIRPDGIFIKDVGEIHRRFLYRYPLGRHYYTLYCLIPARSGPTLSGSILVSSLEQF